MAVGFQLVIDCAEPERLARFWAAALGYQLEPPPAGFASWDDYWRAAGLPEEDLDIGTDSIVDPDGHGPRIWFQRVPDVKTVKNRLHMDIHASGVDLHDSAAREALAEVRRQRVDAAAERLASLGATVIGRHSDEATGHYAIAMRDPEGNEFDIH
jgi:Glyoxalase-like domain